MCQASSFFSMLPLCSHNSNASRGDNYFYCVPLLIYSGPGLGLLIVFLDVIVCCGIISS
jgi:hypothetical protein